jgi:hypothetical protein
MQNTAETPRRDSCPETYAERTSESTKLQFEPWRSLQPTPTTPAADLRRRRSTRRRERRNARQIGDESAPLPQRLLEPMKRSTKQTSSLLLILPVSRDLGYTTCKDDESSHVLLHWVHESMSTPPRQIKFPITITEHCMHCTITASWPTHGCTSRQKKATFTILHYAPPSNGRACSSLLIYHLAQIRMHRP